MRATAWSNGSAVGSAYGIRISASDRDAYFKHRWTEIVLELPAGFGEAVVPLADAFWRQCSELRSAEVGRWFRDSGLAPWPKGDPPVLSLQQVSDNRFSVTSRRLQG